MKKIIVNYKNPEGELISEIVDILNRGGSIIYPTDTVYGLGTNALREYCIQRLFKIKKRPCCKPVPIIVRDIEMAKKFAFVDKKIEKALMQVWPGPVTVVLTKRKDIPEILTGGRMTIGLRIPDCEFIKLLMDKLDYPITATSANFSGEPPIRHSIEIIKNFDKTYQHPDLFVDSGDLLDVSPSTVLDLTGAKPKILRVGPVNKKDLLGMLR
ncbi:L-threonylcarbamoyladenylate synthase [Patescibacteria group bacterium]